MKLKPVLFVALTLGLSSCAFFSMARNLKQPAITYVRCDVKNVEERKADVQFVLSAYNPNTVGLKNVWVSYELFYEGKRFLKGDSIRVELPPMETTPLLIPAEIDYREVFRVAGPMAERVLLGQKTVPVRIDAVISGKPTLYNSVEESSLISFTFKISRTEQIPIPEDQINSAKKRLESSLRKMF
jgi:hypothetical protein